MSEKRPEFGLEEELKRKLKLDGSSSGSVPNQETGFLKPSMGKGNQGKEMKGKVKLHGSASGSVTNQETLKPALKPSTEKGNQGDSLDNEMKKKVRFDLPASGSVANQETLKPEVDKRNQDKEMKRPVKFDVPASGSVPNQETLKPAFKKHAMEKRKQAARAEIEDRLRARMGERSSTSLSLPRSSSKDQAPTLGGSRPRHRTLVHEKRLTHLDVQSGTLKLKVPTSYFFEKRREGKYDRIMVPFMDNKGRIWELEITSDGLSYNWEKFVEAHRLKHDDLILFYDDDSINEYFIIEYKRSGDVSVR